MEPPVEVERTVVLIKPDALHRALVGEIIGRIERKGLKLVGLKMMVLTDAILEEHYSHLKDQPFFGEIRDFMQLTPVIAICVEGIDAVDTMRRVTGITLARQAELGTIRGDLAMSVQRNLIHASDSITAAKSEVSRFFSQSELHTYSRLIDTVVYAKTEHGTNQT